MNEMIKDTDWDVIVIGTGVGGSVAGLKFAQSNKNVLFLEKGKNFFSKQIRQNFNENILNKLYNNNRDSTSNKLSREERIGLWDEKIYDNLKQQKFKPFLGQGVGGSSLFYGAAMERFFPEDFNSEKYFYNQKQSSVVNWPLSYNDFEKYYFEAEELFNVNGGVDPLRLKSQNSQFENKSFTPSGEKLKNIWESKGFHPYRLPIAHKPFVESKCRGCQAEICEECEKIDAGECGVKKAISSFGATLLECVTAEEIIMNNDKALGVKILFEEKDYFLKGKLILLACGALNTPILLLKSKSKTFPCGIGNHSSMVGKNLSRHFMDLYSVFIHPKVGDINYWDKELALNDFYICDDQKFGTVQSLGSPPRFELIKFELYQQYGTSKKNYEKLYYFLVSILGKNIINTLFSNTISIAAIMDDANYYENRVELGDRECPIKLFYKMSEIDKKRLYDFRFLVKQSFGRTKNILHKQGENCQRLAHASGTTRMGLDPNKSVVDINCKVHYTENIYIVDSSIFPTGSGINPALTIAANALRVVDEIIKSSNIS